MFRSYCGTVLGLTCLLLSACQTFSPDGGMDMVASIAGSDLNKDVVALRTPEAEELARARVTALLRRSLTAEAAVQIALLNNRGLQAAYNELGIAEAVMVEASLPPSPTIAFSALSTPVELDIERRIITNILALATLEARAEIARERFRQAQVRAAMETLRLAATVRRAYLRAVAARQLADFLAEGVSAAETAAELARRLAESGSMTKLDQSREQVFYAEMTAQLGAARQRAQSERERLVRTMGLSGSDLSFRLPDALPALPGRLRSVPSIEAEAVRRRVDLQIARIEVDALAKSYGLTNATRFIELADVSPVSRNQRESSGVHGTGGGAEVALRVPIFDFGEARLRQAGEAYMQAVNRLAENAQRPLSGTGRLSSLSSELRHSQALSRPGRAAAQGHLRRDDASLRRHAGRRLFIADRGEAADRSKYRCHRGAAGLLDGRRQPESRTRRRGSGASRRRAAASGRPLP